MLITDTGTIIRIKVKDISVLGKSNTGSYINENIRWRKSCKYRDINTRNARRRIKKVLSYKSKFYIKKTSIYMQQKKFIK